ncbi:TlyA family RNA methyltransferase [Acanthopleuribacter pedis]|uniref:TlyA family RNA methyltransferase n=1 Tax=Acanthopleuribacter pedis TaxID=442870 RepID=A0A8J7QJ46_9BACT|nr:TlyA family RNA methyltransferase [Acanthopleuribacter pedis]MBO1323340.1 TlyA family RNA methyltransferase [Acanthopleuribacter pedis]
MEQKIRLDALLIARGLTRSRSHARDLIKRGKVRHDGLVARKPGVLVREDVVVAIDEDTGLVGRGTHKLEAALQTFAVAPANRVWVDIGASTGGFTQVLLREGARRVYAVDVGHDQLAPELVADGRVVNLERTNIRTLSALAEIADGAVVDLSFISLRLVLPVIAGLVSADADVVLLFKPQFEVGQGGVNQKGLVADGALLWTCLEEFLAWAETGGWSCCGLTDSPILGKTGNREFLIHLRRGTSARKAVAWVAEHRRRSR